MTDTPAPTAPPAPTPKPEKAEKPKPDPKPADKPVDESPKAVEGEPVEVTVFVPVGKVNAGDIKKAALLAARNQIPVAAFDVVVDIGEVSDRKKNDQGVEGRDYTVKIGYTPRRTTDPDNSHEAVTLDKVLASFEPLTPERLESATDGGDESD